MEPVDNYLYQELSYDIIGCAYDAFKTIGIGFDEIRYHKIFHNLLLKKGLKADYKKIKTLGYLGERIAEFEIDEIVENKIIIELKCIQSDFIPDNIAQIMTYLKAMDFRLGILINFGLCQVKPKRIIFDQQIEPDLERWDESFFNAAAIKKIIDAIVFSVRNIHHSLGASYNSKIYQAAFRIELTQNKLRYSDNVCIDTKIENIQFNPFKIDYWLVENSILVGILSGSKKPHGYDLLRMRTYLRRLNLQHGLIAFWSSKNLQLFGIYEP
jgi:GxxExxY protein